MQIGQKIKQRRKEMDLTQQELAKRTNLSRSHIASIENNTYVPSISTLVLIADSLDTTISALVEGDTAGRKGVLIPILGKVVAGIPLEAIEEISGYEEITPELAKTGDFFALEIKGISMEPRILEGDIVIVKKQTYIESGEIAVVLVNGDEATIKQVIKQKDGILLHAYNPAAYAPKFYSNEQIQSLPVEIVGKVVELRGKF